MAWGGGSASTAADTLARLPPMRTYQSPSPASKQASGASGPCANARIAAVDSAPSRTIQLSSITGRARNRRCTCVISASVPHEPVTARVRSKPATFFTTLPPALATTPSAPCQYRESGAKGPGPPPGGHVQSIATTDVGAPVASTTVRTTRGSGRSNARVTSSPSVGTDARPTRYHAWWKASRVSGPGITLSSQNVPSAFVGVQFAPPATTAAATGRPDAEALLAEAGGEVKTAIVMGVLALAAPAARRRLVRADGHVRAALGAPRRR